MFEAIARIAAQWREPNHPARQRAVHATLQAPNRFTREALAFAINQQMALLDSARLNAWIGDRHAKTSSTVGVLNAGNVPLAGLQDLLAVVCTGHHYVGSVSRKCPALLPAFSEAAGLDARFVDSDALWKCSDAIIATGTDESRAWATAQAKRYGVARHRCLLRGHSYSAAVVDGRESADERERLAEDALLHEGMGCRSVALIWAPAELSPDPYLESMAHFRAAFPAHRDTPGALVMQQSLLKALGVPHAYGEGLEFLMSRGPAQPQGPAHIRWVPYGGWNVVENELAAHGARLQRVFLREGLIDKLRGGAPVEALGFAQRPSLAWHPDGQDTVAFLSAL